MDNNERGQEPLIKETEKDITDITMSGEDVNTSTPADDEKARLATCLLENNWDEALKILHNRLDDDPSDLEAKVILAEVYKMSQQPEEGIKYGLEAYEEIKGKREPDDVVGMVFTVSDLLGTISNCYFQLKEYDKAREFADNAESVIGHPTSDTVHVMLHSVYELEGLDAMQKMAEDRYALLSPDMYPDSFAMLKIETARIYFMAIMEYCDQETLQLPEKPLKLLMELAKQVVKMHENLEEVPDEFKDNERFNDLSTLRRQLLFQASTKLYIGNGDINHPEIVSNKQYAGAELCFKCLSLLEEMGEAQVYHLLGLLYRFGAGVEADEKKSFEYLKLSAEKSDTPTDSKALLADCYYEGIGTEKDYEKAYELAMPLAEEDVGLPQKTIGLMYYKGEGVSQNKDEGLYWLKKAASNGVEGARAFLIQEAADNIDDYDEKLAFLSDFTKRLSEDYETTSSDKSEVEKFIRYFSEVEKYILTTDTDKFNFVTFCTEKCPEALYKDGYIQPEYYIEMLRRYVDALSEEDQDTAKEHMDMLKDYNFVMISLGEFVHYHDEGIYPDVLSDETNWSNIERSVDDYLREKGYDIPDKDLGVLSASIAMGTDAFIVYSYSLNAVQLLDQVQQKLEYIYWGSNGYRCQLTRTKLMVNGVFSEWSYRLIENDKSGFSAVVLYLVPVRGDETEAEWNMKCNNMVALQLYFEREFRLDQGAIERITIPPHKEAFDNNGFSFIHSDVEAAYNGSKVLLEPYKTTIHNSSDNPPSWYKTGCTASSWSGAKRGNTAGFGGGNYGTGGSSTGGKPIGKYLLIAGVVILALIIIPNLFKSNRSYDDSYYDDEYYDDEYYDEENTDSYNESDSDDYIDEGYPDNGNDSYYVIGNTYQIQTNLRVREGPGKEYRILNRDELTGDDFANSVDSKTTTDALMEKGKYVKCLGMEGDWMRIESGWICVYDEGEVLVR